MSTRNTNEAVAAYRRLLRAQFKEQLLDSELRIRTANLNVDEFRDYAEKTRDIDAAADRVTLEAENNQWAQSTLKQLYNQAVNNAGLDREVSTHG